MQNSYDILEFSKIREAVASFSRGEESKNKLLSLTKLSKEELTKELSYLDQAINLHSRFGNLPIDSCLDLSHDVSLAVKGATLSVEKLEGIAHDVLTGEAIKHYFSSVTGVELLSDLVLRLPVLKPLEKEIHRIIAPNLTIFDNASPELRQIRISITRLEKEMVNTLGFVVDQNKDYLSDEVLTMRDGHYCLPVANAYKHQVKGLSLGTSKSGSSTFIEPEILLNLSNKMAELKRNEDEEIRRLLAYLSSEVAKNSSEVLLTNQIISRLDFLQAKALYSESIKGHVVELGKNKEIVLLNARHPLLDQTRVVSNNFYLNEDKRILIISGPNAGGKTVALKTLGLSVLMFEAGLPVSVSQGSILPYIENVYLDIGDSQSIQDNLSTFSAHMKNLSEIYSFVSSKDLLLLDEVGTGTSPKEGEAIAYGFIKNLLPKHCFALISSHFEGLKAFALSEEGINNACMLFDDDKLLPTYKLKIGLPGESYGLEVAERFGVSSDVILSAKSYLKDNEDISLAKAISNLTNLTVKAENTLSENERLKAKLKNDEEELYVKQEELKKKQASYLSDIKEIKKELISKASEDIDSIISSINKPDIKLHEVIKAKTKLKELIESEEDPHFNEEIVLNDYVEIASFGVTGKVTRINKQEITLVTQEGQTYKTSINSVRKVLPPKDKGPKKEISHIDTCISKSVPLELNIIGERAAEAESSISRYLDSCRLKGYKRVRIIHGFGSGVLRKVTCDYLTKHKEFVDHFEGAKSSEGAGGATIVYLK